MVDNEVFRYTDKTGKGGHHRVYYPHKDVPCEESFKQKMAMHLVKVAGELLNVTFVVKQNPVS